MTLLDTLSYLTAAFNMPVPKAMVTSEMSINNYEEAALGDPVHFEIYSERVTDQKAIAYGKIYQRQELIGIMTNCLFVTKIEMDKVLRYDKE